MDSILIGQIVNIHGVKGEVKVYPYTDDLLNLTKLKVVYFDEELTKKINISGTKTVKDMLVLKLDGIDTIDEANSLRKRDIYIPKSNLKKLDNDTYYIEDLIGLDVVDINGDTLGTLNYVFNTGANDVYEVKTKNGNIYLPAIKQVVKKIDMKDKKIYVEIMEGLI